MEVFLSAATWVSALAANGNNLRMAPKWILKHIKMARSHDKRINSEYLSVGLGHIFLLLFCLSFKAPEMIWMLTFSEH